MSQSQAACDFSAAFEIAKVSDNILSASNPLLKRIIDALNNNKLRVVRREIEKLGALQTKMEESTKAMQQVLQTIPKRLAAIKANRSIAAIDVLTLGATYLGRQVMSDIEERQINRNRQQALTLIESNAAKASALRQQSGTLRDRLAQLKAEKNPSWWARLMLSIKSFIAAAAGFAALVCGEFMSGFLSLASAVQTVQQI